MINLQPQYKPSQLNSTPKIYFRQVDGTSFVIKYQANQILSNLLKIIYRQQYSDTLHLICKGRLLQKEKTIFENSIQQNFVIHILRILPQHEQLSCIAYINYEGKLFKIPFRQNDSVRQFKKYIEQQTLVTVQKQVLLYKNQFLEDDKKIKQYEIKNQDIIKMGKISSKDNKYQVNFLFPNLVFTVKGNARNRRASAGQNMLLGEDIIDNKNKFAKSDHNVLEKQHQQQHHNQQYFPLDIPKSSSQFFSQKDEFKSNIQFIQSPQIKSKDSSVIPFQIPSGEKSVIENPIKKIKQKKKNIFQNMKSVDPNLLKQAFSQNDDNQYFALHPIIKFTNQNGQHIRSLEAALAEIMGPGKQQFCQSYYEKQGQQNNNQKSNWKGLSTSNEIKMDKNDQLAKIVQEKKQKFGQKFNVLNLFHQSDKKDKMDNQTLTKISSFKCCQENEEILENPCQNSFK